MSTVADGTPVRSNCCRSIGRCSHTTRRRCWRPYGSIRPVLKHGPRSLTCARVSGWSKPVGTMKVKIVLDDWGEKHLPFKHGGAASSTDLFCSQKGLSKSVSVGTRKMVNYAWIGWSQRKHWWKLVAILTCKSIVEFGYSGERLIEPSSSWFPPKFPSG